MAVISPGTIYVPADKRWDMLGQGFGNLAGNIIQGVADQKATAQINDIIAKYQQQSQGGQQTSQDQTGSDTTLPPTIDYAAMNAEMAQATRFASPETQRVAEAAMRGFQQNRQQQLDQLRFKHESFMEKEAAKRDAREETRLANTEAYQNARMKMEEIRTELAVADEPLKRGELLARLQKTQLEMQGLLRDEKLGNFIEGAPDGNAGLEQLKHEDPGMADIVQKLGTYQMKMPSTGGMSSGRSSYWTRARELVAKLYPNFQENGYKVNQDFTTGVQGRALVAGANAIEHLQVLNEAFDQLHNGNTRYGNFLRQQVLGALKGSNPELRGMENDIDILGEEVKKYFSGTGGGTQMEWQAFRKNLSPNATPEERKAATRELLKLMGGQMRSYADTYNAGTGFTLSQEGFMNRFMPSARQAYETQGGTFIELTHPAGVVEPSGQVRPNQAEKGSGIGQVKEGSSKQGLAPMAPPPDQITAPDPPMVNGKVDPSKLEVNKPYKFGKEVWWWTGKEFTDKAPE